MFIQTWGRRDYREIDCGFCRHGSIVKSMLFGSNNSKIRTCLNQFTQYMYNFIGVKSKQFLPSSQGHLRGRGGGWGVCLCMCRRSVTINLTIGLRSSLDICFDLTPVLYTQQTQIFKADPVDLEFLSGSKSNTDNVRTDSE